MKLGKKMLKLLLVVLFIAGSVSQYGYAGAKKININGKLVDKTTLNSIVGDQIVTFSIYDGTTKKWEKDISILNIQNGLFNVALEDPGKTGSGLVQLDALSFDKQYSVAVTIGGKEVGRQDISASGYALGSLGDFNVGGKALINESVGIGTANPGAKLHVEKNGSSYSENAYFLNTNATGIPLIKIGKSATAAADTGLSIGYNNSTNIGYLTMYGDNPVEGVGIMLKRGGNVGVGTADPGANLQINRNIPGIAGYIYQQSAAQSYLNFGNSSTGLFGQDFSHPGGLLVGVDTDNTSILWNGSNTALRLGTNATERLRIDQNGNVGIGTANPQALLDLGSGESPNGNVGYAQKFLLLNTGGGLVKSGWGHVYYEDRIFFPVGGHMSFGTISTTDGTTWNEKLRINSSGDVGIGTTNPGHKLVVATPALGEGRVQLATGGNPLYGVSFLNSDSTGVERFAIFTHLGSSAGDERLTILRANGNVGIGTANPGAILHVEKNGSSYSENAYFLNTNATGIPLIKIGKSATAAADTGLSIGYNNSTNIGYLTMYGDNPVEGVGIMLKRGGNVGIGTTTPGQKLSVAGIVQSTSGGFMFPDGTTQTSAAAGGAGVITTLNNATSSRTVNTAYQNTTGKNMYISVVYTIPNLPYTHVKIHIGSTNNTTTQVAYDNILNHTGSFSFVVPPNYYYSWSGNNTGSITWNSWIELY